MLRAFLAPRKHTVLLVVAVLAETLQSMAKGLLLGVLFDSLVALLVLAVFLVVLDGRWERTIGLFLAVPALVANWLHYVVSPQWFLPSELLHHVFMCAFFLYSALTILRSIFRRRDVNADAVVGAVCGYLLAGAAFGNLYTSIELLHPGSFSINTGIAAQLDNWHARRFLFGYFSLVTLTSMGYGDVTPVAPAAASLTWIEAVFGQFYLAVVVAQLVGARIGQRMSEDASPPKEKR
jgi:voltage-gated potassium channel